MILDLLFIKKNQIMKNLIELGKTLSNQEQQQVNGGWDRQSIICNNPYYSPSGVCQPEDFLHPQTSAICCSS